jgi:hypothetical protein
MLLWGQLAGRVAELRAAESRYAGPLIGVAEDLRCYVANQERRQDAGSAQALKEPPPPALPDLKD